MEAGRGESLFGFDQLILYLVLGTSRSNSKLNKTDRKAATKTEGQIYRPILISNCRGQINKETTLVIFTRVIYTCKVQLVNTRIK